MVRPECRFAPPGLWADADPGRHLAWYRALGVNVIQTFCVSCNGHAWYKGGVVPEQPGLRHDFLRDLTRLAHAEKMQMLDYFCTGSNTRWAREHPDLSYGTPSEPHIPCTDEYLANWNRQDPLKVVPAAMNDGVGLYGFVKPGADSLPPPIADLLGAPFDSLAGDARNLAVLARAFAGKPLPEPPPTPGRASNERGEEPRRGASD